MNYFSPNIQLLTQCIMKPETNNLIIKLNELDQEKKYDEILSLLTDEKIERDYAKADLYIWRGNAWYNKKEYDKAIVDYTKVIDVNPNSELAYYNRGIAWIAKKEYDNAITDYDKVIELNPNDYAIAYLNRASIRRVRKDYKTAIDDFNKAIELDPKYADAYYNRGLAKKENNIDLKGSKDDFEQYLNLTADENYIWSKYAKYYIEDLDERINDVALSEIVDLVSEIKNILRVDEVCITHYSSLSALKSLLFDKTKFRLSEGNFMNDPSEGIEFFKFMKYQFSTSNKDGSYTEIFSSKPFIGSFVTKDKDDDLNMWRFYGKEDGIEAKGCSITLYMQKFIDEISNSLIKGEEDSLRYKSDINFYRVTYLTNDSKKIHVPNLDKKEMNKLSNLIINLKGKVKSYNGSNRISIEKYLNKIAFLFKSDAYKNENEVRLVVQGIEFEKKYNMNVTPPRVYIELEIVTKILEKITLGPRMEKASEWASAFYYSFGEEAPKIVISHLPYK